MAQPVDAKAYYGYLFEADKKPTKTLDALLRGIANHIVSRLEFAQFALRAYVESSRLTSL